MSTTPIPDDQPITVTWNTVTTERHSLTLPYGQLREEIDRLRARRGRPRHPDLAGDLDLLEDSYLADHEEHGAAGDFERSITGHNLPLLPQLAVFTVTVAGSERHDGEAGYTYVLHAADIERAKHLVLAHHIAEHEEDIEAFTGGSCEPDVIVIEGPWDTFPGAPAWPQDLPGRAWEDLRANEHLLAAAYRQAATS